MIAKPAHLNVVGGAAHDGEDALDQVFAALADPVRRSILSRLDGQELLVSQIAQHFDISLQAVSKHIQVLVRAGLVAQERTGRISRCSLTAGPIFDAAVWLNRYSKYWQAQFDLLAATIGNMDRRGRTKARSKRTSNRRKGRPTSGANYRGCASTSPTCSTGRTARSLLLICSRGTPGSSSTILRAPRTVIDR